MENSKCFTKNLRIYYRDFYAIYAANKDSRPKSIQKNTVQTTFRPFSSTIQTTLPSSSISTLHAGHITWPKTRTTSSTSGRSKRQRKPYQTTQNRSFVGSSGIERSFL